MSYTCTCMHVYADSVHSAVIALVCKYMYMYVVQYYNCTFHHCLVSSTPLQLTAQYASHPCGRAKHAVDSRDTAQDHGGN